MRVVVAGGGIIGLSTAWYLRQQGLDVVLVDKAQGPGLETSFANGSLVHPSYVQPWNEPGVHWQLLRYLGRADAPMLLRMRHLHRYLRWGTRFLTSSSAARFEKASEANRILALYTKTSLGELREQLDLVYGQYFRGSLNIFRDAVALEASARSAKRLSAQGIGYKVVDRGQLVDIEPALSPIAAELEGGIHYKTDEGGNSYQYCKQMADQLAAHGVELRCETEVGRPVVDGNRVTSLATVGGAPIEADAFVLACATDTAGILRPLNLKIPVMPVKGYSLTLPATDTPACPKVPVIDADLHAAVIPIGADSVRLAGTAEFSGYDRSIDPARIDNLYSMLKRIFPEFAREMGQDRGKAWAGLRPMSADGTPLIGQFGFENLFLNTGHSQIGWSTAAGSGRLLADIVCGRQPDIDPAAYSPDRF